MADTDFDSLQTGLTVRMIATPRTQLKTCFASESVCAVLAGNTERYDYIPVVDDDQHETIVGLFQANERNHRNQNDAAISKHMLLLSERHLIGEHTSIQNFIREADAKPCRLVVAESGFSGLVTLSDLQKLPVRAALFGLMTGFEMAMFDAIKRRFPKDDGWLGLLDSSRRATLSEWIKRSKKADGHVDDLLFTAFGDKATIIRKSLKLPYSPEELEKQFDELRTLRNKLAHANEYAASPTQARWACGVVINLLVLRTAIASADPGLA